MYDVARSILTSKAVALERTLTSSNQAPTGQRQGSGMASASGLICLAPGNTVGVCRLAEHAWYLGIVSGPEHRMFGVIGVLDHPSTFSCRAAPGRASCAGEWRRDNYKGIVRSTKELSVRHKYICLCAQTHVRLQVLQVLYVGDANCEERTSAGQVWSRAYSAHLRLASTHFLASAGAGGGIFAVRSGAARDRGGRPGEQHVAEVNTCC